ncbi:MAG: SCP2 sterol-binding domain-containing protein [Acidiferrobacterales bacterium]|nr:SCP2 sterol-binding domain-containing protein [Acidiferrobacterales bacterium]
MSNPYTNYIVTSFSDRLLVAIGEAAQSDEGVRSLLQELDNRIINLRFTDLNQQIGLKFSDAEVFECDVPDEEADLVVQGTLFAIIKAVFSENRNPARLQNVKVTGDLGLAQRLYQVFDRAEFDFEEILAQKTGDIPARQIGNLLRWGSRNLRGEDSTLATSIRETLIDRKQLLPTRSRVEKFMSDVDGLQADLDRLEKRTDRLNRRTGK